MFYSILRPHPYDIQVEDGEAGGKMTMVAIARGHDENRIVSVVCEMVETEIGGALHWEFSFSIDVFALDAGIEPFRTQERQMAAPFIPDSIRASVMAVVCESLKCLANHVNPMLIYWVTKDREPPKKGLRKYHMLRETLESVGYSPLSEGTDPFGRRFWTMRRNPH
jgi:hypothetical protein